MMWLSGLHIPESYLTALVQATCRKNGWPLDRSTLYTAVTEVCSHIVDECISCDTICVHLLIKLLVIYCYSSSILMLIRCLREHRQVVILVDCI